MSSAIEVSGLWKQYRYGTIGYGSLRRDLQSWWARLRGREDPNAPLHARRGPRGEAAADRFWALEDVSFSVEPGEVVGIIGRNGAGKSTLLKILSRITSPTRGQALVRGRLASLLEVGTGFHPDLTGRENIYLNGAILGMRRYEIGRILDQIVEFAGVAEFLDTPVKRYSTGMYLRLAFAVAAHLEAEILLVDEVLAVGDAQFQRKCLGKIGDVAREGRTVLFVSHNLGAVQQLCSSAIWLEAGTVRERSADVRSVVEHYLAQGDGSSACVAENLPRNRWLEVVSFGLLSRNGRVVSAPVPWHEPVRVRVEAIVKEPDPSLNVGFALYAGGGELLFWSVSTDGEESSWPAMEAGRVVLETEIPAGWLNEGFYRVELIVSLHHREWLSQPGADAPSLTFEIAGGFGQSPHWTSRRPGLMAPVLRWQVAEERTDAGG